MSDTLLAYAIEVLSLHHLVFCIFELLVEHREHRAGYSNRARVRIHTEDRKSVSHVYGISHSEKTQRKKSGV